MQDFSKYKKFAIDVLGVEFNDINQLLTAFTHRSYLNEHRKTVKAHNERLEFLGDAVLELVVTEYLYSNHADPEGILTNCVVLWLGPRVSVQRRQKMTLSHY